MLLLPFATLLIQLIEDSAVALLGCLGTVANFLKTSHVGYNANEFLKTNKYPLQMSLSFGSFVMQFQSQSV